MIVENKVSLIKAFDEPFEYGQKLQLKLHAPEISMYAYFIDYKLIKRIYFQIINNKKTTLESRFYGVYFFMKGIVLE